MDWQDFAPLLVGAALEWLEALTVALAASLTIGRGAVIGATMTGLVALFVLMAAMAGILGMAPRMSGLPLATGICLLLFGARRLSRAIACQAGWQPSGEATPAFLAARPGLFGIERFAAWLAVLKGVLLAGLEVWLVVAAFSLHRGVWQANVLAAVVAFVCVCLLGTMFRGSLRRVPANAITFMVGVTIVSFGTFWTLESLAGDVWPLHGWSLLVLAAFYLLGGQALVPLVGRCQTLRAKA
jgi:uncharacterized membrane protein